jgi:hypothetical protein
MLPKFLARRLRWTLAAAAASAVYANRRDATRWWQFARRSVTPADEIFSPNWWTEARVRAAVTLDRTLRRSAAIDDVEVRGEDVLVRTHGGGWPDLERHLDPIRRVKGVSNVRCQSVGGDVDAIEAALMNAS